MDRNFLDFDAIDKDRGDHVKSASAVVTLVGDFCTTWIRTVKTIGLYPPSSPIPDEFRQKFYECLTSLLEDVHRLDLLTTDGGLVYEGSDVYVKDPSEETAIDVLFRDGIRRISFDEGLSRAESDRFLSLLAESCKTGLQIDIANLLWEAGFDHIQHYTVDRVVEGIYIEPADTATLQQAHEDFVDETKSREVAKTDDPSVPYGGFQRERFKHIMESFGEIRFLTDAEKTAIVMLATPHPPEETERMGLDIIFEICRSAEDSSTLDNTLQVMQKQFAAAVECDRWDFVRLLLTEWRDATSRSSTRMAGRFQGAINQAAGSATFDRLAQHFNANPQERLDTMHELLRLFGTSAITAITGMLRTLEHRPARMAVCDFLSEYGAEAIDLIGNFAYDQHWFVVRNVAMILGAIGNKRALVFLQKTAGHTDPRVRRETLRAAHQYDEPAADRIIMGMLNDAEDDIRRRAIRVLGQRGATVALKQLTPMIEDSALVDKNPQEIRELFIAFARLGGDNEAKKLLRIARKTRMFGNRRWLPVQIAAVQGLGASNTITARSELEILARKGNPQLAQAARDALEFQRRGAGESPWQENTEMEDAE